MILNFNKFFTSKLNEPNNDVLDKVHVSLTVGMNEIFFTPYTLEELENDWFSIRAMKESGSYGGTQLRLASSLTAHVVYLSPVSIGTGCGSELPASAAYSTSDIAGELLPQ